MRVLITGSCGFVGTTLAREWARGSGHELFGVDNLIRSGSEANRAALKALGVTFIHGDIRQASDFESLPGVDWVVDAAANPSVLAGIDGLTSSRQLIEHNLLGTINMLEYCRRHHAGFILLSTSRVYSIEPLTAMAMDVVNGAFRPVGNGKLAGLSEHGLSEHFATTPPISLYGATKLASEQIALEYGATFDFPVWINRCGVLAGAGQFGRPDQGIFSFWIHSWRWRRPLSYIGFDGLGHQVRDCLHPADLIPVLDKQVRAVSATTRIYNVSGGSASARSLRQCSDWCRERFGPHDVSSRAETRRYDVPWMVLDARRSQVDWDWTPTRSTETVFEEIAQHADSNPDWLERSAS